VRTSTRFVQLVGAARQGKGDVVHTDPKRWAGRFTLIVVVMLVAFVLPVAAMAGRPTTFSASGADAGCELDEGFLFISVFEEEFGVFVDVFVERFEAPPLFGFTDEAGWDGTTLSATVELFEGFFDEEPPPGEEPPEPAPVGEAVIEAMWEPIGEPEVVEERLRDGNRWVEFRDMFTLAALSGVAELLGTEFDLAGCEGSLFEFTQTSTNPHSFIGRFEGMFLECGLEGDAGFGGLFADSGEFGTFVDVFIEPFDDPPMFGFTEDAVFTDEELSAVVPLFSEGEGPTEPMEAVVSATLTSMGLATSEIVFQDGRVKVQSEQFEVEGTVAVGGDTFTMVGCFAESFSERIRETPNNGPKAKGRTPANDVPAGAVSLDDGRKRRNAQTKATANAPEMPCTLLVDFGEEEEPFEVDIPIGKTLWYTFEGTGGDVTINTARSDFDTVLGIYDSAMEQVTCVDDVENRSGGFSLQAKATVPTVAGETYYVQIGGFGFFIDGEFEAPAQFGRLRIRKN
jgi:hypothetical protein